MGEKRWRRNGKGSSTSVLGPIRAYTISWESKHLPAIPNETRQALMRSRLPADTQMPSPLSLPRETSLVPPFLSRCSPYATVIPSYPFSSLQRTTTTFFLLPFRFSRFFRFHSRRSSLIVLRYFTVAFPTPLVPAFIASFAPTKREYSTFVEERYPWYYFLPASL